MCPACALAVDGSTRTGNRTKTLALVHGPAHRIFAVMQAHALGPSAGRREVGLDPKGQRSRPMKPARMRASAVVATTTHSTTTLATPLLLMPSATAFSTTRTGCR